MKSIGCEKMASLVLRHVLDICCSFPTVLSNRLPPQFASSLYETETNKWLGAWQGSPLYFGDHFVVVLQRVVIPKHVNFYRVHKVTSFHIIKSRD